MNYFIDDMYEYYKSHGGKFDKTTYKKVCSIYNQAVIDHLLRGKRYILGARLRGLQIVRVDRNFDKPRIDWNESLKLKNQLLREGKKLYDKETGEGEHWLVYFTSDDYVRVLWERKAAIVKNRSAYKFIPSRGTKGLSTRLKAYLHKDPRNKYTFRKL